MITTKIQVERKPLRFPDERTMSHCGHSHSQPRSGGTDDKGHTCGFSVYDKAARKAVYHIANLRPWTSATPSASRGVGARDTRTRGRPKTTSSVLRRDVRKSLLRSPSASSIKTVSPTATPKPSLRSCSQDAGLEASSRSDENSVNRMSGVDPPLVSGTGSEDRRPATAKGQPSGRRSAPSRAEYFDLSSSAAAKNADRKLASRSADKVHPRLNQSPMLTPTAHSASGPRPAGPQMNPWSVTEVPEEEETNEAHVGPSGEAEDAGEESSSSSSEEEPEPEVTERFRHRRLANRRPTVHEWSEGPAVASDEYDTDLEEDFPPDQESLVDATGALFYEEKCQKKGIVPVTYLLRNMGEGNLRMRHHYLGGDGTRPLAQALKKNTVCEEIDLSDNYIEGSGAAALADTLKENMFIVNLNVSNNFIRSEGAEKMAEMLESNTTLKTLSLQGNQLSDQDAKRIAESLKNNMSLSCLDLSHNKFGEVGGIFLAQGIALNIGLADLDLSWNCIREKGGVAIAKALAKNTALEILDLSWNGLSYTGTVALANALKSNKTLKVLDLSNNRMNPEGAKVLGKALAKNIGLETLLLGLNPMGADGVEAILKGAAAHPRLKLLGVENTMDLTMVPHLLTFVKDLQESRDIMIMATTGPPQQSRINTTVLAVFDRFLTENADRMEDLFNQMDKDGSGDVTLEELKYGLKDFGLRLTSKQLDTLLDELDADKSGTIEYSELMQGTALIKREKQKMDRAAAELMMYKENPAPGPGGSKSKTEVAVK